MPDDLIRYDILTQEALRSVIRKVLDEVGAAGLPGEHHFFISFDTSHPGVRLSKRMRERYPEAMTIVIQHTFWNLKTSDTGFEVDLTFNDIRERLRIPFAAIQSFFDPSVKFGLQFDTGEIIAKDGEEDEIVELPIEQHEDTLEDVSKKKPVDEPEKEPEEEMVSRSSDKEEAPAGEVVSLDSFRKKK